MGFIENVNELLPLLKESAKFLNENTLKTWVEQAMPLSLQDGELINQILHALLNSSKYSELIANLETLFKQYEEIQRKFNKEYISMLCEAYVKQFFNNLDFRQSVAEIIYTKELQDILNEKIEHEVKTGLETKLNELPLKELLMPHIKENGSMYAKEILTPITKLKEEAILSACILFNTRKLFLIGCLNELGNINKQVMRG